MACKKVTTIVLLYTCTFLYAIDAPKSNGLDTLAKLKLGHITAVSVDQLGRFYFVLNDGRIQKRDPNGKLMHETTLPPHHLSLIEAWNPLSLFIYSQKGQRCTMLSPRLDTLHSQPLNPALSVMPGLACPDNRPNKIWVLDNAGKTLKKIDLNTASIEVESPLPEKWVENDPQITFMRAYQNEVFLLNKKKGIHVLSNIGIPITTIETEGLTFFNFIGGELCYTKEGKLLLFDLYSGETRLLQDISHIKNVEFTIATDERLVIVTDENVYFITL